MPKQPKVSIVVPIHAMQNGAEFLWRLVNSLTEQTFKDWELIITKDGKMAENTNSGIKRARGKWIKIMYLDDYFSSPHSLMRVNLCIDPGAEDIEREWLITPTDDNPKPQWTDDIETGNNKLGSPSALTFKNHFEDNLLFDEKMSWLLDCDFYKRMYDKYGKPTISLFPDITLGKGDHQMTHILTNDEKLAEHKYITKKYA